MSGPKFHGKILRRTRPKFSPRGLEILAVNVSELMRVEVWRYRGENRLWYGALYIAGEPVATALAKTSRAAVKKLEERWGVIRADLAAAGIV